MAAGKHIKRLRELKGVSADTLSKWIGVKADRLRKWESRDADPKLADRKLVEDYFKCPINVLETLDSFEFYEPETKPIKPIPEPENNRISDTTTREYIDLLKKSLEQKESEILNVKSELKEIKDAFEELKKVARENRVSLERNHKDLGTVLDLQNALIEALSVFLTPPPAHPAKFEETVHTIFVRSRSAPTQKGSKAYMGKTHT